MSIVISTDIFCDECGDWTDGVTGPRSGKKEAKRKRWHVTSRRHLCPICKPKSRRSQ